MIVNNRVHKNDLEEKNLVPQQLGVDRQYAVMPRM
jgi:hypothetical protein